MENTSNGQNPLAKYFRQPAIYMKLPSKGQFWPEGSLNLPVTGEIPVYPMTARDEVTLRTPDALMNGTGVIEVIQSCCPSIIDAWKMPSIDVDAVFIAVRIASYGYEMPVDTKCPHCGEENNHTTDLRNIMGSIACPDYSKRVEVGDLRIRIKPQQFFNVNRTNTLNFEEQRLLESVRNTTISDEERIKQVNESMQRLVDLSIDTVVHCTDAIEIPDGASVTDPAYIKDFYNNADGSIIRTVQKRLNGIVEEATITAQTVACGSCHKEYQVPLEFDYANFFVNGS